MVGRDSVRRNAPRNSPSCSKATSHVTTRKPAMIFLIPTLKDVAEGFFSHSQSRSKIWNYTQTWSIDIHMQFSEVIGSVIFYQIPESLLAKKESTTNQEP